MTAKEVREKYLNFFKAAPRNHVEIEPAPLVLADDPTTLFTSAGMQPLVPYLKGEKHPEGKRLVNSQPAIRLQDIEEVGNNRHTTFFEMLGNWSLGDYFKDEQLAWFFEFLTKELSLPKEKLWVSAFEGNDQVSKDTDSVEIWKKLGIPKERTLFYDANKNWWSISGPPDKMTIGDIGGPDSEVFYDFGESRKFHENSPFKAEECHPNCDCGRFLEIGNSVFIQYRKVAERKLEELPNKNVDFGGGLERLTAAANDDPDVFKTDLFDELIKEAEDLYGVKYGDSEEKTRSLRIVVEHLRASAMLTSSGVLPSNKTQGYVLRRLLRRALFHSYLLAGQFKDVGIPSLSSLEGKGYPIKLKDIGEIEEVIKEEMVKFFSSLRNGVKLLQKEIKNDNVSGKLAFDLYQTSGVPIELTLEILQAEGVMFDKKDKEEFEKEFDSHKEKSRTAGKGMFKGGLADHSPEVVRLHTATHLLQAALRKILGNHVLQKGQNITAERSRFDFSHADKLTEAELKEVENLINEKISEDLPVNKKLMPKEEAEKTGAIHAFGEKYGDMVNVYYVGRDLEHAVSREFCGGPHVASTSEIGRVRIIKQEKVGSGIVRVYLAFE